MQTFERKQKKQRKGSKAVVGTEAPSAKPADQEYELIRKRAYDAATDAAQRAQSKQNKQHATLGGSWLTLIGASIAMNAQTAATVCRAASTNPYVLVAGVVVALAGLGLAAYFKFFA